MTLPSPQNSITIKFAAEQIAAQQAIITTIAQLPRLGISQPQCCDVEIALAEAVNNVVEHACSDLADASACITCAINDGSLNIEISDTGRPLPELRLPAGSKADLSGPLEDLPEGGFGWFLIRQIAAHVHYERVNGRNRLILEFRTEEKSELP
jgi:serine/threonine-protein kinase RsbW